MVKLSLSNIKMQNIWKFLSYLLSKFFENLDKFITLLGRGLRAFLVWIDTPEFNTKETKRRLKQEKDELKKVYGPALAKKIENEQNKFVTWPLLDIFILVIVLLFLWVLVLTRKYR